MLAGIRLALCAFAAVMLSGVAAAEAPLLPRPAAVVEQAGAFTLAGARIAAGDDGAKAAAGRLGELLARAGHKPLPISAKGTIRFLRDPAIEGGEAYRLVIAPDGITVSASTDAGLYYGAETLWQLILAAPDGRLAAKRIDDVPAFAWRGVMLDSARHFQPVAYVKQLIDRMAMVKLNRLHWHLTDDQGWRLPVPGYPRLTTVGADGQFYSEAEIREVVAYAAQHQVEIVPEVDMPGHFTAAVAAYLWLASTPVPPTAPSGDWGILPNLINPDAKGMAFVEAVLDQLMALFPGKVIHIGGDEAVKDQWNANPAIQAQIKALGLKDAEALQAWFTGRVTAYLEAHGHRAIGWDEILGGPLPGDAVVMSWRGIDGAIAAARAGHDAVLAPAPVFYLDNRQSASDREPPGRGEIIDWKRLYQAEIAPPSLTASEKAHILGLQVNLWTEHVRTTDFATRMIWPRADVLAEMGWAGAQRDWNAFVPRLLAQMRRERQLGLAADRVPLEAMAKFEPGAGDTIRASLRQPAAIGTMRYTIDGTPPDAASPAYAGPLGLVPGTVLNARAFAGTEPLGEPQRWTIAAALTRNIIRFAQQVYKRAHMERELVCVASMTSLLLNHAQYGIASERQ
jgi:hexosaminidase